MRVFDCHTHFFSYDFFAALARAGDRSVKTHEALVAFSAATGIRIPTRDSRAHLKQWLTTFDENDVARAVMCANAPEEAETVAAALDFARERLLGFCVINPTVRGVVDRIHRLAGELGYRGVQLSPALDHYHLTDPLLQPVLTAIGDSRMVALVHFGIPHSKLRPALGLPEQFDASFANTAALQVAAGRFPHVNFMVPHFGFENFHETLMLGIQCENVFVDTSGFDAWIHTQPAPLTLAEVFHKTRAVFGFERMLFGTDSGVFPPGWRRDILEKQLQAMEDAGFSESERDAVLYENAARLFER